MAAAVLDQEAALPEPPHVQGGGALAPCAVNVGQEGVVSLEGLYELHVGILRVRVKVVLCVVRFVAELARVQISLDPGACQHAR